VDDRVDRRFERRLWWLLLLLLLLALLVTGANLIPGPAWAEMPADRALLAVERGRVEVTVDGRPATLDAGAEAYLGAGDRIRVRPRAAATLTFRGGASTVLCAGTRVDVGPLWSRGLRPVVPHGRLTLDTGRILADTAGTSDAFDPLALTVDRTGGRVSNQGAARFAVAGGDLTVASGEVRLDDALQRAVGGRLDCGDGAAPLRPDGSRGGGPTTAPPTPTVPQPSIPTPSVSPTPTATPSPSRRPDMPSASPTRTLRATLTPSPTTSPTPPDNRGPVVRWVRDPGGTISQDLGDGGACQNGQPTRVYPIVSVRDDRDPYTEITVTVHWSGFASGSDRMSPDGDFYGTIGPVPYSGTPNAGGTLKIWVTATDGDGVTTTVDGSPVAVSGCRPVIIG
jgi:putative peptide zinc metalloprotease protein